MRVQAARLSPGLYTDGTRSGGCDRSRQCASGLKRGGRNFSVGAPSKVRMIRLDRFRSAFNFRLGFNPAYRSRKQIDRAQCVVGEVASPVAEGLRYVARDLPEIPELDSRGIGGGLGLRGPVPRDHNLGVVTLLEALFL